MDTKLSPTINYERVPLHELIPLATPLVVYVEPSGFCNFRCRFCPHGAGDSKQFKKNLMAVELFAKMVEDLSTFPDRVELLRVCGNGEPLMNRDILDMLGHPKLREVTERIELVTNGSLLTPRLIDELPRRVDRIIISIEGLSARDYERLSGIAIDFDQLVRHVEALHAASGHCTVHVKMPSDMIRSGDDRKAFFDLFVDKCDEMYIENLVPMWPQFEIEFGKGEFRWGGTVVEHRVCPQIFKGLQVQADGEVVPCCVDWNRVNLIGDITRDALMDVWNGDRLRRLQIAHLAGNKTKLEPCRNCTMNDYCEVDNIDPYRLVCLERLQDPRFHPR